MRSLIGARELGLVLRPRFGFLGLGSTVIPTPGELYLDVGGVHQPGIVDHHGEGGHFGSTAAIVLRKPELFYNHLISPWLARHQE